MQQIKEKNETEFLQGPHQLLKQINYRWSSREIMDNELQQRQLVISKNLNGSKGDSDWLAKQLAAYCKNKKPGFVRLYSIENEDQFSSGQHAMFFWTWRDCDNDLNNNIKIIFSTHGENDSMDYWVPILINGQPDIWSKEVPFYDTLRTSIQTNATDRNVWNLACKLKELGFIEESVLPEGRQRYPKNAIRLMQDYFGLDRTEYNENLHRFIWGEFKISIDAA